MKSYTEMAQNVLARRDAYFEEQKRHRKQLATALFCFCLVAALGVGAWKSGVFQTPEPAALSGLDGGVEQSLDGGPKGYSVQTDLAQVETGNGLMEPTQNQADVQAEDAPAHAQSVYREAVDVDQLSREAADIFCGSYINAQGYYIVLLTENTAENRALICKELGIRESEAEFQVGTYTLEYLTAVQERISDGMVDRTFPFVAYSALYEDQNRIDVSVTTTDAKQLAKLKAVDPQGALEITDVSGSGQEDVMKQPVFDNFDALYAPLEKN